MKKKSKLKKAQEKAQAAINRTNDKIEELGSHTNELYLALTGIQDMFDRIRNKPGDKLQYDDLKKIRLNWKQQAEKIEKDYENATIKNAGAGVAGAGLGVAVVTMGPTVAMGVATTFGVASTGTAISTLSGVAATNAALAWLGGGAIAAGGGGMLAGEAFLAMAGPVGWAIAGVSVLASGLVLWKSGSDKKRLEDIFTAISNRDVKSYELAIVELSERITRIIDDANKLNDAIEDIRTYGLDYNMMTEAQQYNLGTYVNLMLSSTQLLINPIKGLTPKFSEEDIDLYISWDNKKTDRDIFLKYRTFLVSMANLLFRIELDEQDKKVLWRSLRGNKSMLQAIGMSKKEFDLKLIDVVLDFSNFKYGYLNSYKW